MNLRLSRKKENETNGKNLKREDDQLCIKSSVRILISRSRFGVEINVSPKPLSKLIIVDVSCKRQAKFVNKLLNFFGPEMTECCVFDYTRSSRLSYRRCLSKSWQRTRE